MPANSGQNKRQAIYGIQQQEPQRWLPKIRTDERRAHKPESDYPAGDLRPAVEEALASIDAVHLVSGIPDISIFFTDEERYGGYQPETERIERRIELSRQAFIPR